MMKKTIIKSIAIVFGLVLAVIAGIIILALLTDPDEERVLNLPEGAIDMSNVELLIEVIEVTPNDIEISELPDYVVAVITNHTDEIGWGGVELYIERFNGIWWSRITPRDWFVHDIGVQLDPGQSIELKITLMNHERGRSLIQRGGRYRVVYYGHYGEFTIS